MKIYFDSLNFFGLRKKSDVFIFSQSKLLRLNIQGGYACNMIPYIP